MTRIPDAHRTAGLAALLARPAAGVAGPAPRRRRSRSSPASRPTAPSPARSWATRAPSPPSPRATRIPTSSSPSPASWPCCATPTCSSPPGSTSSSGCRRCSTGPGNRKVSEGGPGYVTAYTGIHLLEVPTSLSRSEGDIHADGNPHIHTDPVNGIIIARNILTGLRRVSPDNAAYFSRREQDFERRVLEATIGADLVQRADRAGRLRPAQERQAVSTSSARSSTRASRCSTGWAAG